MSGFRTLYYPVAEGESNMGPAGQAPADGRRGVDDADAAIRERPRTLQALYGNDLGLLKCWRKRSASDS